jgi:hypothetical protein
VTIQGHLEREDILINENTDFMLKELFGMPFISRLNHLFGFR